MSANFSAKAVIADGNSVSRINIGLRRIAACATRSGWRNSSARAGSKPPSRSRRLTSDVARSRPSAALPNNTAARKSLPNAACAAAMKSVSTRETCEGKSGNGLGSVAAMKILRSMLQTFLIRIPVQASHLCRIHSARLLKPTRVSAPIAAAGFAVPLGHAFPFFAVSENGASGFDLLRLFTSRNAVNGQHDIGRTALRTRAGRFTCCRAAGGQFFHCRSPYPESLLAGLCERLFDDFLSRMAVLDATGDTWPIGERGFSLMASSAYLPSSERLLDQLDGGRGIEN